MDTKPVFGHAVIATGVGCEVRGGYEAAMAQLDTQMRSQGTYPLTQLTDELDAAATLQRTNTALTAQVADLQTCLTECRRNLHALGRQYQGQVNTLTTELATEREQTTLLRHVNAELTQVVKDIGNRIKQACGLPPWTEMPPKAKVEQ